jgi:hypothetical protein
VRSGTSILPLTPESYTISSNSSGFPAIKQATAGRVLGRGNVVWFQLTSSSLQIINQAKRVSESIPMMVHDHVAAALFVDTVNSRLIVYERSVELRYSVDVSCGVLEICDDPNCHSCHMMNQSQCTFCKLGYFLMPSG